MCVPLHNQTSTGQTCWRISGWTIREETDRSKTDINGSLEKQKNAVRTTMPSQCSAVQKWMRQKTPECLLKADSLLLLGYFETRLYDIFSLNSKNNGKQPFSGAKLRKNPFLAQKNALNTLFFNKKCIFSTFLFVISNTLSYICVKFYCKPFIFTHLKHFFYYEQNWIGWEDCSWCWSL